MRVKSNLKTILDDRKISIRQFADMTGLKFETLRRLYNDDTKQYQRDTIGRVCEILKIDINELLVLIDDTEQNHQQ
ncbi:helix-turn-helix domain-containing protein [Cytobacillus horneckiae]|uniref:XRE family transcriptional regulator n=1 Tax=Cytobacillus horneckiae TaxID=549687 RepID=A0A2N0ZMC8_9BACI|nr:helix-turn-helix transcriptional regulator [Cytobacillus horneckiae]MEC1155021.1 helix-turn-helix transcriptional regulator [Cytobacillus horneckiae]MED2936073.1 helix-turn-helix transcriptional regulator [Cytobacillus horneckiae]PKG30655.1 XRE family transcriptional regulator [Cytobacillus horneckiae]